VSRNYSPLDNNKKMLPTFIIEDLEILSLALGQELGPSECGDFLPKLWAIDITSK